MVVEVWLVSVVLCGVVDMTVDEASPVTEDTDEERVLEEPVDEESVLIRDMVDEDVSVEDAGVDEELMIVDGDTEKGVDE